MLDSIVYDSLHRHWVYDEAEVNVAADPVGAIGEACRRRSIQLLRLAHNTVVVRLSYLLVHGADNSGTLPTILCLPALPKLLGRLLRCARLVLRIRSIPCDIRTTIAAPQDVLKLRLLLLQLLQMLLHLLLILQSLKRCQLCLILKLLAF